MSSHFHVAPYSAGFSVDQGVASGCPFCMARTDRYPAIGKPIVFLSGSDVGQNGVVVPGDASGTASGKFLAKMGYMPEGHLRIVDPLLELFVDPGKLNVPSWMPSLSIEDACALHEQVLESLQFPPQGAPREAAAKVITGVVARCWGQRLPLNGEEIWMFLAAHGVRAELKTPSIELFDFGMALLVGTQGRPPIKRKKMSALSHGRYHTKNGRELWVRLLGHE